jgi:hypothetical protein
MCNFCRICVVCQADFVIIAGLIQKRMKFKSINSLSVGFYSKKTFILLLAVFLFCVVAPHRAEAAISFDAKSNSASTADTDVTQISWTHVTGSSLMNGILIIGVSWRNSGSDTNGISSITYGGSSAGITLIRTDGHDAGSGSRHTALYYLLNPGSGSKTIAVNFSGSGVHVAEGGAVTFEGVDQDNPIGPNDNGQDSDTEDPVNVTVNTSYSDNFLVDIVCIREDGNSPDGTPDSSQTELFTHNHPISYGLFTGMSYKGPNSSGNATMEWDITVETKTAMSVAELNPAGAGATWYGNSCWQYRKKLTLDAGLVAADLTDFPVLISFTGDSDLTAGAQSDFDDVLFTSADGTTKLSHEIEAFDSTNGDIVAWVKIPSLSSSSDTDVYMYYGCGTACNQQNAADVWSNDYVGVWHLKETTGTQSDDSTSYANHGTPSSPEPPTQDTGQIDGGLYFDDDGDANERNVLVTDDDDSLDLPSAMTVSAWVKTSDAVNDVGVMAMKWSDTASQQNYWLGKLSDSSIAFYVDGGSYNVTANLSLINDGTNFHHVVAVADPDGSPLLRIYVDGIQRNTASYGAGTSRTEDADLRIGNSTTVLQEFEGTIDEVRVQRTNRSAAWIETEYNNLSNQGVGTGKFIKSLSSQKIGSLSWYNSNWLYRKKLTLDSSMVSGDLSDFPVLVSLTSDSDLAADAQNDHDDILFTLSDGTTKLAHEIEKFDEDSGELIAWVKVPSLNACVDTDLYMYYGYDTVGNQENAAGVWSSGYEGVWHLKEDPDSDGGTEEIKDSTSNANHGDTSSLSSSNQVAGQIDGSLEFDDSNERQVLVDDNASLQLASDMTVSVWMKLHSSRSRAPG